MNKKRRLFIKNKSGVSPVLEAIIAIGISVSLLIIFYVSTTNIYDTHERMDVDVEAKAFSLVESLLRSTGIGSGYNKEWDEEDSEFVNVIGLATTETVVYGKINISKTGMVNNLSYYTFPGNRVGIANTCFLAGTKIVMADGSYKNIEDIKTGDMVKSYDLENGKIIDRKVTQVFHHQKDEMEEYYLLINKQLRVTPNHLIYSNDRWIKADDLKIGDNLFYPCSNYKVWDLKKVFKQSFTYDFEVEGNHNYFVALDKNDVLVHNPTDPPNMPIARFNWFDNDGPYAIGGNVTFNAEDSEDDQSISYYQWDFDNDGNVDENGTEYYTYYDYGDGDDDIHVVTLNVTDNEGNYNITTKIVQPNTPNLPLPDSSPWVLTGKNVYPHDPLTPFPSDYHTSYEEIEDESTDNYTVYLFEVKEKTNPSHIIIDYEKINNIKNVIYPYVKAALGLDTDDRVLYDFNITIRNNTDVILPGYGASAEFAHTLKSIEKDVLIYYKPQVNSSGGIDPPYYEKGSVMISVFIGGIPPNYPPLTPRNPDPDDGTYGVRWDATIGWDCWDPDGDPVTYDIFLEKQEDLPFDNPISNNYSERTYDPDPPGNPSGLMTPDKKYYWKIKAWDNHDQYSEGPQWWFYTKDNNIPYDPYFPYPYDDANAADVTTNLTWRGGDPDEDMGDYANYSVYFNYPDGPTSKSSSNATTLETLYDPTPGGGRLDYGREYLWKIIARDIWGKTNLLSDEWNFTTAEKGLDQQITEGLEEGYNTSDFYMGQTFTAGKTGILPRLNLSLKAVNGDLEIWIQIWNTSFDNPISPDPNNILANGNVTLESDGFVPSSFEWKTVFLDTPFEVQEEEGYFIVIRNYSWGVPEPYASWQYNEFSPSGESGPGGEGGGDYPRGEAYWWDVVSSSWRQFLPLTIYQDFLFKTYAYREPDLNQYCLNYSDEGIEFTDNKLSLGQKLVANRTADLMKINFSLKSQTPGSASDITVSIYQSQDPNLKEVKPNATTTIEGFSTTPDFIWREAIFTDITYFLEGKTYWILINTSPGSTYEWEKRTDTSDFLEGEAYTFDENGNGQPINPETDFIFATYMDDFG